MFHVLLLASMAVTVVYGQNPAKLTSEIFQGCDVDGLRKVYDLTLKPNVFTLPEFQAIEGICLEYARTEALKERSLKEEIKECKKGQGLSIDELIALRKLKPDSPKAKGLKMKRKRKKTGLLGSKKRNPIQLKRNAIIKDKDEEMGPEVSMDDPDSLLRRRRRRDVTDEIDQPPSNMYNFANLLLRDNSKACKFRKAKDDCIMKRAKLTDETGAVQRGILDLMVLPQYTDGTDDTRRIVKDLIMLCQPVATSVKAWQSCMRRSTPNDITKCP